MTGKLQLLVFLYFSLKTLKVMHRIWTPGGKERKEKYIHVCVFEAYVLGNSYLQRERARKPCMYNIRYNIFLPDEEEAVILGWQGSCLPPVCAEATSWSSGVHRGPRKPRRTSHPLGLLVTLQSCSFPGSLLGRIIALPALHSQPLLPCNTYVNAANWFGTGLTSKSFI